MSPNLMTRAAAALDAIHASGGDLALLEGSLVWVERPDDRIATRFEAGGALEELVPALTTLVRPWICAWCGCAAEAPDCRCDACTSILSRLQWAIAPLGGIKHHAVGDGERSLCVLAGLALDDRPIRPTPLLQLPADALCRRCVRIALTRSPA